MQTQQQPRVQGTIALGADYGVDKMPGEGAVTQLGTGWEGGHTG